MTHKRYLVTGTRRYRDHEPGDTFEAVLDPEAEKRAIARGSIRLLEVIEPQLQQGRFELPRDWPQPAADAPQPETRVSRVN